MIQMMGVRPVRHRSEDENCILQFRRNRRKLDGRKSDFWASGAGPDRYFVDGGGALRKAGHLIVRRPGAGRTGVIHNKRLITLWRFYSKDCITFHSEVLI